MENITLQPTIMTPFTGMAEHAEVETFTPKGVCAKLIRFKVEGTKLAHVDFTGGCEGNLKAVSTLVKGMELTDIINTLSGITCGKKKTSCADQLCRALQEYMDAES